MQIEEINKTLRKKQKKINARKKKLKSAKKKKDKYHELKDDQFCGKYSGNPSEDRSYPVNTAKRCSSALSMARHANNPNGIASCAIKKALKNGWKCGSKSKRVKEILSY